MKLICHRKVSGGDVVIYVTSSNFDGGAKIICDQIKDDVSFYELEAIGILNIYACIAVCNEADEYLNNNSWEFHEHMGFSLAGRFHSCGKKFGNTYDMIWMEKIFIR